jgi:hypothetical protein
MHLAAESIPVAEKQGVVNASVALKIFLYNPIYDTILTNFPI